MTKEYLTVNDTFYQLTTNAEIRRKEILRKAHENRQIALARSGQPHRRFHYVLLNGFGTRLIAWGESLRHRYGPITECVAPAECSEPSPAKP